MIASIAADKAIWNVVIVGGGTTGLSTAYYLQQAAAADGDAISITLVEESPALGGKLVTEKIDGFIVEGEQIVTSPRNPGRQNWPAHWGLEMN